MSCNIKTIKTCEIFSDSIFARSFSFDEALQKVTAKIQKSDSPNVQNIELTKISNIFSLEIEPLNLAVGNYKITYIFEILISGKLIRKTGLIENLSILKIGCNCEKSENENLDFSIELNQTVIDVELNFSVLNIGSISESGKSAFDIAVENGFVGTLPEWLESLKGIDGQDGEQGERGEKGENGEKGEPFLFEDFTPEQLLSLKGEKGDKGDIGERGIQGEKGDVGERGLQGIQGLKGENGDKGDDGYTPIKGVDYFDGAQGIQGIQGEKGDVGERGLQGIQGLKGDKGEQGLQGMQGLKGDKGDTGANGAQGLKGDKGDKGEAGTNGTNGVDGSIGPKGDTGDQGLKGDKGDTGNTGLQGGQGIQGTPGEPSYTHIRYSANAAGTGFNTTPNIYIGLANTTSPTAPTLNTEYVWYNWKGANGTPGVRSYLHIRYANNSAGTGFNTTPNEYIGLANTTSSTAPVVNTGYTWYKIKGEQGIQGVAGTNGTSVQVLLATSEANALTLSAANPNNIYYWT